MGQSYSKTKTVNNTAINIATSILQKYTSSCSASNGVNQNIKLGSISITGCSFSTPLIEQSVQTDLNFSCVTSNNMTADIKNDIASALKSDLLSEAGLSSLNSNVAVTEAVSNFVATFNASVDMEAAMSCAANQVVNQSVNGIDVNITCTKDQADQSIGSLISQEAVANIAATCIFNNSAMTEAGNALQTVVDQQMKASSGLDTTSLVMIAVAVIVIGLVVLKFI